MGRVEVPVFGGGWAVSASTGGCVVLCGGGGSGRHGVKNLVIAAEVAGGGEAPSSSSLSQGAEVLVKRGALDTQSELPNAVAVHPGGGACVASFEDGVRVVNLVRGKDVAELSPFSRQPSEETTKMIGTPSEGGKQGSDAVREWKLAEDEDRTLKLAGYGEQSAVAFAEDGTAVVLAGSASQGKSACVRMLEWPGLRVLWKKESASGEHDLVDVNDVAVSPDGAMVASTSGAGRVTLMDARRNGAVRWSAGPDSGLSLPGIGVGGRFRGVCFATRPHGSPDTLLVAGYNAPNACYLVAWRVPADGGVVTGSPAAARGGKGAAPPLVLDGCRRVARGESITRLCVSAGRTLLAVGTNEGRVMVHTAGGTMPVVLDRPRCHGLFVTTLAFGPARPLDTGRGKESVALLSASADTTVRVLQVPRNDGRPAWATPLAVLLIALMISLLLGLLSSQPELADAFRRWSVEEADALAISWRTLRTRILGE